MTPKPVNFRPYIFALIGTIIIFSVAFGVSQWVNKQKTDTLKAEEDQITIQTLSLETQFDLTGNSCTASTTALTAELQTLGDRLTYMETQVGSNDPDLSRLKRYYSLLEIKDYLLHKDIAAQCHTNDIFILYFYSDHNCSQCTTEGYILGAAKQNYPNLRVYSFDYDLDLPAVETLISLNTANVKPPIITIQGVAYTPFSTLSEIKTVLDGINVGLASSTATTTPAK